jgi:tetratricopeptide (TPR) repeat protein
MEATKNVIAATVVSVMLAMAETPSELNNRGVDLYRQARYTDAEGAYRAALDGWKQTPGAARDEAVTLNNLAVLYRAKARYADALAAQQESIGRLRAIEGDEGRGLALALANLADLQRLTGDAARAESTAREALAIHRARGARDADYATALQVLASAEMDRGNFRDARGQLEEALAIRERTFGVSHPLTGSVWSSLATLHMGSGDYKSAETAARKALAISTGTQGQRHPATAACLNNVAQALRFQGRYSEAEPLYRQAIGIWEATLGRDHPDTAKGVMNLAALHHSRGWESLAEALYLRARDTFARNLGPNHPETLMAASGLVEVYRAELRFTDASKLARTIPGGAEQPDSPAPDRTGVALGLRVVAGGGEGR